MSSKVIALMVFYAIWFKVVIPITINCHQYKVLIIHMNQFGHQSDYTNEVRFAIDVFVPNRFPERLIKETSKIQFRRICEQHID